MEKIKQYWATLTAWVGAHAVISAGIIVALAVATVIFMIA